MIFILVSLGGVDVFRFRRRESPVNTSRTVALVISMALMLPGSLAVATMDYSHPPFSITEDRTLNLRETGSQIVMETVEDVLQQGGLSLLGEGFQIDSSLSWGYGGELDAVIPIAAGRERVIFAQPGLVLWDGWADEERIDGNFGIVYRAKLANTPVGVDAVGGTSLFYDHDFQVGHSRISLGADIQSGIFHGAFNYYQPLSSEKGGRRKGFAEEAVGGMDLQFALEKNVVRTGIHVGYWNVASDWKTSAGFDIGFRLFPGVFIEGEWEKHQQELVSDERLRLGVAARFSLPGFEGASYSDGEMSKSLYKVVDREKRILYQERDLNRIALLVDGSVVEDGMVSVAEGESINVTIQLERAVAENITLNLIGSGSAEYGSSNDWVISVGGTECTSVIGTGCQITIMAGEISASDDVVISINEGRGEGEETIILSSTVVSGDASLTGDPLVINIPAEPPLLAVSSSTDSSSITEGNTATITLTLSEALKRSDVAFNLIGSSDSDDVTYGASNDWSLSVGGTDCDMASESDPCQVMIPQGNTTAEVIVKANKDSTNEMDEAFTVSVEVDSVSEHLVQDNPSSLDFTILPIQHTIFFSGGRSTIRERINDWIYESAGGSATVTLNISPTPTEPVNIRILVPLGGYASYGNRVSVSGATLTGTPSTNNLRLSVPANPGTITLSIRAQEDGNSNPNTALFRISPSLPHNYKVGTVSDWQVRIFE